MIECLAKQDIKTADELCDAVQDCKKEIRHTQVGKRHKIMGAGGKTILLIANNGDKEFVAYEDVINQKGHFGKLLYRVFFEEEDQVKVSVDEVILDLEEKLTVEQIADLTNRLVAKVPNRLDLTGIFHKSEDFSDEIKDALFSKSYTTPSIQLRKAFGMLNALDVEFDAKSWKSKTLWDDFYTMQQDGIDILFSSSEKLTDKVRGIVNGFENLENFILSQTDYGDFLFRKTIDGEIYLVVIL